MSILSHTLWSQLRPYFKIEVYSRDGGDTRARVRIEVNTLPPPLFAKAICAEMPCVACGATVSPIRERQPPGKKRGGKPGHLYYAATCPLDVRIGCSRGKEARDEYTRVKDDLRPDLKRTP